MNDWIQSKNYKGQNVLHLHFFGEDGAEIVDDGLGEISLYSTNDSSKCLEGKFKTIQEAKRLAESWS